MAHYRLKQDFPDLKKGTEGVTLGPCKFKGVKGMLFFAKGVQAYVFFTEAEVEKWIEKIV